MAGSSFANGNTIRSQEAFHYLHAKCWTLRQDAELLCTVVRHEVEGRCRHRGDAPELHKQDYDFVARGPGARLKAQESSLGCRSASTALSVRTARPASGKLSVHCACLHVDNGGAIRPTLVRLGQSGTAWNSVANPGGVIYKGRLGSRKLTTSLPAVISSPAIRSASSSNKARCWAIRTYSAGFSVRSCPAACCWPTASQI